MNVAAEFTWVNLQEHLDGSSLHFSNMSDTFFPSFHNLVVGITMYCKVKMANSGSGFSVKLMTVSNHLLMDATKLQHSEAALMLVLVRAKKLKMSQNIL